MQRPQHLTRNVIGALVLLSLLFGMVGAAFAPPFAGERVVKPVPCVSYDPQDEPPGQDFDSHNCPGVH